MTSETGSQTIAIYILPNISQSKGNQTLKFGQLIEHYKRNIFLQRSCGKWVREASSKLNMRWKQLVCSLVLIYFDSLQLAIQQKNKLCKILDYLSRDTLNFHFSEKALGLVSLTFCGWFFKKNVSHVAFNWPTFIVWLPLLLEILDNMCITVVC